MAVTSFVPTIWSAALQGNLDKSLVAAALVNTDYQGDLAYGKTVTVNRIGAVTVAPYDPNSTTITPEQITTTSDDLDVDQARYFAIKLDDVDAAQVRAPLLNATVQRGAYALRDEIDQFVLGLMTDAASVVATDYDVLAANQSAFGLLVSLGTELTNNAVPRAGRFAIVSPDFEAQLVLDTRLNRATDAGDAVAREGFIGRAAGFDIFVSHNIAANTIVAGTNIAASYVGQVDRVEAYRDPASFSDIVRALVVFGGHVFEPDALVQATFVVGAGS